MVSIKHKKVLTIADDPAAAAAGMVVPTDWNNVLDFQTAATAILLGRLSGGAGDVEELTASQARTLLELVKGTAAGNIPVLDGSGKLDTSILPAIAITEPFVVNSQSEMLALSAQTGDVAIRTDLNKTFILSTNSPGTLADWKEMLTPTDAVLSVAGLTGAISASALKTALAIAAADITDASANGRSLITAANYAAMRTLLGLVVGTNVQAFSNILTAIAGLNLTGQDGKVLGVSGGVFTLVNGGGSVDVSRKGFVSTGTVTTGAAGQDNFYVDITVSAVADYTKTKVVLQSAGAGSASNNALCQSGSNDSYQVSARMTSNTNVRISCARTVGATSIVAYWQVENYS